MRTFQRPTTPTVSVRREPVEGRCPACGAAELAAYPVLSEQGWWRVCKCQRCLHSLSREPGPLLGVLGDPRPAGGGAGGQDGGRQR